MGAGGSDSALRGGHGGLATLGIITAQNGDFDGAMAALRTSFTLARQSGSIEDIVRAAANQMYLLCTSGRFTEALEVARAGRQAARSLDAPPSLTSVLDNNTAAVLTATGRWAEADQMLAELVGESAVYGARNRTEAATVGARLDDPAIPAGPG
ncbi:MAG: hypothetical protein ACHP9Z_09710 [Streptosporangiales bacterium]